MSGIRYDGMMNHGCARVQHRRAAIVWLATGAVATGLFASGQLPSLRVSILLMAGLTVVAIATLRLSGLSTLSRLFVLLFSLPFSATLGYLFDLDFTWLRSPNLIAICRDHVIVTEMLGMAIVGLCGLMAGIESTAALVRAARPAAWRMTGATAPEQPTLQWPAFSLLLISAFVLSWLHAPAKTIFEAAYYSADSGSTDGLDAGLNATYLVSYLILILLYIDAERDQVLTWRRRYKRIAVLACAAYIVVMFQFLHGDRECAGLVVGLTLLHITRPTAAITGLNSGLRRLQRKRLLILAPALAVCIAAFLLLGTFRHTASATQKNTRLNSTTIVDYATHNTWTAVSRNNLGLAVDYHYGSIEYLNGRTYADYAQSLPPQMITNLLCYTRPMDGEANPSNWYACLMTIGGIHPVIVPFRNFGIWGVFPIMFLFGALICFCEIFNEQNTVSARLLFGSIATCSMLWFWYGDMTMIRALMAWGILSLTHRWWASRVISSSSPGITIPESMPVTTGRESLRSRWVSCAARWLMHPLRPRVTHLLEFRLKPVFRILEPASESKTG